MPKTRTVTCGKCGNTGHNARTCKAEGAQKVAETAATTPPPPPPVPTKTRIDMREDRRESKTPRRLAPTADRGTAATAAPYQCAKCNSVAILLAVRVKDHGASFKQGKDVFASEIRCEKCMNKPVPTDLILKWGVRPGEVVPIPGQDE